MILGEWELKSCENGKFGLDGGAMFGVVPKTMWAKLLPADDANRIPMVMRNLVARGHGKTILVDAGAGGGYEDKLNDIYAFEGADGLPGALEAIGIRPAEITDVVLTHLHFDHGAGIAAPAGNGWKLQFPGAVHHVTAAQYGHALNPNPRDRASYFKDRIEIMEKEGALQLHDGAWSLCPGFDVLVFDGHTPGQQLPKISGGGEVVFYCGDLIPTQHHIPGPYIMAYDLDPVLAMKEKVEIVEKAHREGWILFFEHDPHVTACRVADKGKYLGRGEIIAF